MHKYWAINTTVTIIFAEINVYKLQLTNFHFKKINLNKNHLKTISFCSYIILISRKSF